MCLVPVTDVVHDKPSVAGEAGSCRHLLRDRYLHKYIENATFVSRSDSGNVSAPWDSPPISCFTSPRRKDQTIAKTISNMLKLLLAISSLVFRDAVHAEIFVPPAEACLPGSGLTELSGCAAMVRRTELCKTKGTLDERLECACVQELLTSYYELVLRLIHP